MKNNIINGYDNLQHNLIDLIREEEAKLGYRKENIRLYYPLSSLCHMFGCDVRDTSYSDMVKLLEGDDEDFRQYTDILGVSHSVIKKTGSALRLMKMEWNIFTIILTRMSL